MRRLIKWASPIVLLGVICFGFFYQKQSQSTTDKVHEIDSSEVLLAADQTIDTALIDVPLENQNDGTVPLENGCEITALSMVLNYYGYDTNKNDLANRLNYVPVYENEAENIHGNPHEGFVGNIYGGLDAMGVAVEPIAEVASEIVGEEHTIVAGSKTSFDDLVKVIESGTPVWVVTTVDFEVPTEDDLLTWQTTDGEVTVSPLCHAAVVTGVDDDYVYVNDPYGYKDRMVDRADFEKIYQKMGEQSLYLTNNKA
ncbi:C39 family peptidase [Enterococcus xiangfangensis]|uniref:C39 family peptidase n=1 Tax=Enterococcus xiangfangensis TaxID=1296537 RepID=UPI0035E357B7